MRLILCQEEYIEYENEYIKTCELTEISYISENLQQHLAILTSLNCMFSRDHIDGIAFVVNCFLVTYRSFPVTF